MITVIERRCTTAIARQELVTSSRGSQQLHTLNPNVHVVVVVAVAVVVVVGGGGGGVVVVCAASHIEQTPTHHIQNKRESRWVGGMLLKVAITTAA